MWWAAVASGSRTVTSEVSSLGGGQGEGLPGQQPWGVGLLRPRQMLGAGTLMPAHRPGGRIQVQNVKFLCCEQTLPFAADGEGVWSPGGPLPCKAVGRRPEGGSFSRWDSRNRPSFVRVNSSAGADLQTKVGPNPLTLSAPQETGGNRPAGAGDWNPGQAVNLPWALGQTRLCGDGGPHPCPLAGWGRDWEGTEAAPARFFHACSHLGPRACAPVRDPSPAPSLVFQLTMRTDRGFVVASL